MSAPPAPAPVLAVLEDPAAAGEVLEWMAALAGVLRRDLELVHVQSANALLAAALPTARVLAPGGSGWRPLTPPDVERGFRVQTQRLQELATGAALRHAVRWTLRTVRGEPVAAALAIAEQADLVLLAGRGALQPAPPPAFAASGRRRRARRALRVTVMDGRDGEPARALEVARRLAQALDGEVRVLEAAPGLGPGVDPAWHAAMTGSDLMVVSRRLGTAVVASASVCPLLLVG